MRIDAARIEIDGYDEFQGGRTVKFSPIITKDVESLLRSLLVLNDAALLEIARTATNEGIL